VEADNVLQNSPSIPLGTRRRRIPPPLDRADHGGKPVARASVLCHCVNHLGPLVGAVPNHTERARQSSSASCWAPGGIEPQSWFVWRGHMPYMREAAVPRDFTLNGWSCFAPFWESLADISPRSRMVAEQDLAFQAGAPSSSSGSPALSLSPSSCGTTDGLRWALHLRPRWIA
jgi:hypothetical protein